MKTDKLNMGFSKKAVSCVSSMVDLSVTVLVWSKIEGLQAKQRKGSPGLHLHLTVLQTRCAQAASWLGQQNLN